MAEPARILVVCTANICRSPVAERLLQRHLTDAGHPVVVTSAGVAASPRGPHPDTIAAAAHAHIDLSAHRSRTVTREIVDRDGRDLVVTLTRDHLRHVVGLAPDAWTRTFTLKELARRAALVEGTFPTWAEWSAAMAAGRRPADLLRPDPNDDLADPYGRPVLQHVVMVHEVDDLTTRLARRLPVAP